MTLASAMYHNLGVNWASSTLAFLSIAFIPIPFLLYKVRSWRETLRKVYMLTSISMDHCSVTNTARSRAKTQAMAKASERHVYECTLFVQRSMLQKHFWRHGNVFTIIEES
jgi:hypothetical protein